MTSQFVGWTSLKQLSRRRDSIAREMMKRVREERASIEGKLLHLERYGTRRKRNGLRRPLGKQGKARIKYRGPEPGQTWSGRGHMPCWMRTYVAVGKSMDQWLVS